MNVPYDKDKILSCIQSYIEEYVSDPYLNNTAVQSLRYKEKEFIFSKVTYAHFSIWDHATHSEDVIRMMASVELFVLACDILDDLQDMDTEKEPWMKIETKFSMDLVYLFLTLPEVIIQSTSFPPDLKGSLLHIYARTKLNAVNGQNLSLQRKPMSEEKYLSMIEKKSGSFIGFASLAGSINASTDELKSISQYSVHIGASAQIENDLLGISERQKFKDIFMKEISLPIIYLLEFEKEHGIPLNDYYKGYMSKEEFMKHTVNLKERIEHSGAIVYSRIMQNVQLQKAFSIMDQLYQNEEDKNRIKQILFER